MSKLDFPSFEKHLRAFDFARLFVDVLGWNRAPAEGQWQLDTAGETAFSRRTVAELGGVVAIQIVADGGWPDEAQRLRVWKHIAHRHAENLLIFTDRQDQASQSQWYWVKQGKHLETGKPRLTARRHEYFRGQPVDLFASKLQAMVVELSELDATGRLPVLEAARRIQAALDVEKTTKKFFTAYQQQHLELLAHIQGIDNERDKRWYASVLLNRLMFVWFLQKKFFLDGGNADYLHAKLAQSQQRGPDRFFGEFLNALFFEAFAKLETERSPAAKTLTGQIPYLNGGLFLHHKLELDAVGQPRVGITLTVADAAFQGIFDLFASFTWHLDDTPGGDADEINPDVLGYIFEKYINQKAFGAYYTRPEITGYLAERSIHQMILERVHEPAMPELGLKEIKFDTVADLLARMDARTALKLVNEVLPGITILDPAVGSGAFLVAALKCLINIYYAIVGRAEMGASRELKDWLTSIQKTHASVGYYIKRRIVTDNLHGVDIMEEACEIAKLRLFLAMVSSVGQVEHLEPLPNIDFNILPGNSLVGLMRVDEVEFNQKNTQLGLFSEKPPTPFTELLATKNRHLDAYRHAADLLGKQANLRQLRDDINTEMKHASGVMNELLRDQFEKLGVRFEQATWDAAKHTLGKPQKRPMETGDIAAQTPFHWGYVFDKIVQERGGFDIILANPPWEVFKPQAKEFFAEYSDVVSKNKMTIKEFEKESAKLLQNPEVQAAWLAYESRFPHMSGWFRAAPEFKHQSAVVGGKKTGSDVNLYKLFVERSFHLLRPGGHCGIVIPSGIYTDLGAKGLRDLLFEKTHIQGLFCFENRKEIFEGVHRSFKFVVLTFEKCGGLHSASLEGVAGLKTTTPSGLRLPPLHSEGELNSNSCSSNSPSLEGVARSDGVAVSGIHRKLNELPYNPALKQRARELRKAGNLSEVLFWNVVKQKQLNGLDFDRQRVIGNYIVDFYCHQFSLVVEIDGSSHNGKEDYDAARDQYLNSLGLKVLHISDDEVKRNMPHVIEIIQATVNSPSLEGVARSDGVVASGIHAAQQPLPRQASPATPSKEGELRGTTNFPAAFMRHDVAELTRFPQEGALWLEVELIKRLSPDSFSVMEFKGEADVLIAEKMLKFPLLGEKLAATWNIGFTAEFHMTSDSHLFKTEPGPGRLPLFEGKMIWQFDANYLEPRYWVDVEAGRKSMLGRRPDEGQSLDYQAYRLGFRDIAANTNERTLIAAMIPPTFHGNKLPTAKVFDPQGNRQIDDATQLFLCAVWNSFVMDWVLRQKVTTTINFFYLHQLPVSRLSATDPRFWPIAYRAARLTCTTPEFDDLAQAVGLKSHQDGATDPAERARLRAELDGLIAHLYGLSEAEFAHILGTFPLVAEPVKIAALNAWRDVQTGLLS